MSGVWGRSPQIKNELRRFSGPRKPGADGQCRRGPRTAAESRLWTRQIPEIARAAVRAGAANADREKRAFRLAARDPRWVPNPARPSRCGAFYLIEPRPLTLTGANRCPGSRADLGSQVEGSGRCPPGPCRCWAAAPVWSGPRAAESRFVTYHRSSPKQENRRGDSRGEFGLCDPRRSHATTGASVRLASVAQAHPLLAATASAARVRAATVFRPAEAGRGRPVPARRAHGSGEPIGPCERSLRSPGQQFAPAQLTRAGKNAPSALPFATRAGSPTQRGHHAAGAFYLIEPRPLTLTCANRCPGSRADLGCIRRRIRTLPSRAVPVLGGRARLERATHGGASLRLVPAKRTEAGKPARRFPRRVRPL